MLFEHKSYPEEYPHFQLVQYLLNYWRDQLKDKQELRPIVPVVIYHGKPKWNKRPMRQYFEQMTDLLANFLPDCDYYLINLTDDPHNRFALLQSSYAKLTAGLLKTIRQKQQLKQMLEQLKQVIDALASEQLGEQFVRTAFLYVSWASPLTTLEVVTIFRSISPKTDQLIMSAAETWIQEGVEKGLKQGMQQGMQQGEYQATLRYIEGMLRLGMDAQTISAAFDLPLKTVEIYIATIQKQ